VYILSWYPGKKVLSFVGGHDSPEADSEEFGGVCSYSSFLSSNGLSVLRSLVSCLVRVTAAESLKGDGPRPMRLCLDRSCWLSSSSSESVSSSRFALAWGDSISEDRDRTRDWAKGEDGKIFLSPVDVEEEAGVDGPTIVDEAEREDAESVDTALPFEKTTAFGLRPPADPAGLARPSCETGI
jgi:hypothetical protein